VGKVILKLNFRVWFTAQYCLSHFTYESIGNNEFFWMRCYNMKVNAMSEVTGSWLLP